MLHFGFLTGLINNSHLKLDDVFLFFMISNETGELLNQLFSKENLLRNQDVNNIFASLQKEFFFGILVFT